MNSPAHVIGRGIFKNHNERDCIPLITIRYSSLSIEQGVLWMN
jgi:hypothetical protein